MSDGQSAAIPSDPLLKNPVLFLLQKSGRKDSHWAQAPQARQKENTSRTAKKKLAGQRGSGRLFRLIPAAALHRVLKGA